MFLWSLKVLILLLSVLLLVMAVFYADNSIVKYIYTFHENTTGMRMLHEEGSIGPNCTDIHLSESPLPKTALASFPGSGNTWLRHIIHLISGLATGSVYYDQGLLKKGFIGEGLKGNQTQQTIAIKTHFPVFECCDDLAYSKAILLIRDPGAAIKSTFLLQKTQYNHTGHIMLTEKDKKEWEHYAEVQALKWIEFHQFWLNYTQQNGIQLLLICYADLIDNLVESVHRVAAYLDVELTEKRLQCVVNNSEGLFHRSHSEMDEGFYFNVTMESTKRIHEMKHALNCK